MTRLLALLLATTLTLATVSFAAQVLAAGAPMPSSSNAPAGASLPAHSTRSSAAAEPGAPPSGWYAFVLRAAEVAKTRLYHLVNLFVSLSGFAWYLTKLRRAMGPHDANPWPTTRGAAYLVLLAAIAAWITAYTIRALGYESGHLDECFTTWNSTLHLGLATILFARLRGWFSLGVVTVASVMLALALTVPFFNPAPLTLEQCGALLGEFAIVVSGAALIWSTSNRRLVLACGMLIWMYSALQGRADHLKEAHPQFFYYGVAFTKLGWLLLVPAMLEKMHVHGRATRRRAQPKPLAVVGGAPARAGRPTPPAAARRA